jgi:hypothetical protein
MGTSRRAVSTILAGVVGALGLGAATADDIRIVNANIITMDA